MLQRRFERRFMIVSILQQQSGRGVAVPHGTKKQ